ncbi:MAG: hypothetical protein Q7S45_05255 [Candidatus Curtissbacteria bacterium]|nr:hypothetical protein [Candidatus Curtissbacteria bacterium]
MTDILKNFKLWSQTSTDDLPSLRPKLEFKNIDSFSPTEKETMWEYLERLFFLSGQISYYDKYNKEFDNLIVATIEILNHEYKYFSYGKLYLSVSSLESAQEDFRNIFFNEKQSVILEMFSFYIRAFLINVRSFVRANFYKKSDESDDEYEERINLEAYKKFDDFANNLNDVFDQFSTNFILTRMGFVPRQEDKIIKQIYEPVLALLSDKKWKDVNRELKDAFNSYQQATDQGYSDCLTHAITAIEAFLQIMLYGKTGKGTLSVLIKDATSKSVIPNDVFSNNIFSNLEKILSVSRKKSGNAHPKEDYATEKNARLILNLAMVFIQHSLQSVN